VIRRDPAQLSEILLIAGFLAEAVRRDREAAGRVSVPAA
jgi:hypothetical protein